jgi:site-specific DNA-methyltransferase (adenine-specific)
LHCAVGLAQSKASGEAWAGFVIRLLTGDCLDHLKAMPSESVAAVLTDPPYGLSAPPDVSKVLAAWMAGEKYEHTGAGFMGAAWDSFVPGPRVWREVLRVLKPGGHAVVFGSPRCVDLLGISVRLAGFEVRDTLHWAYWSGFPKSLDISKDIDRLAGAEREVVGTVKGMGKQNPEWNGTAQGRAENSFKPEYEATVPATEEAKQWDGWGTALKPSIEPALLLRKPIRESSIARQVLATGTGALNLDSCRFAPGDPMWPGPDGNWRNGGPGARPSVALEGGKDGSLNNGAAMEHPGGRFPANLVSVAKASRAERELGCDGLPTKTGAEAVHRKDGSAGQANPRAGAGRTADSVRNFHPTVKPLKLIRWLVRLVGCQPGSIVLDPFMGSGTTGMAAVGQGFGFVGCELLPEHMQIARARIEYAASGRGVECDLEDTRAPAAQADLFRGG